MGWLPFVVIGAAILVVIVVVVGIYNGLVNRKVQTENAWAQVDVQLKRRYDLIPNLVETVKGYAGHEKETLEKVVQARNMAVGAGGVAEQAEAENMLTGALKSLFALSEAYPDLKANQNFLKLQDELSATENLLGSTRQFYNDAVRDYNTALMRFPTNTIGGMFGFRPAEFFQLDSSESAAARKAPEVKF